MCVVVPLVAGWRETQLYCWTYGQKKKKKVAELFFFFFSAQFLNYIKVKITVTPNRSPCSAWRHKTCNVSFLRYSWTVSQPDSQPMGGWVRVERRGGGGGGECPPSASLLWSSGCRAAAPQCRTSSWAPLDPSSIWSSPPPPTTGQSWLSAAHSISHGGGQPLLISQYFDTEITLAGRCISHVSGFFFFLYSDHLTFSDFFFHVDLHAVVCKLLAAEQALHCSYAETLWSEVPLYVHPVYWMQNEDQYYRPLMIVNCVELLMLLCLTVFCSTSRLVPWVVFKKKKEEKKKGFSDRDVCVCRSKLLRLFSICPSPSSGPLPSC